MIAVLLLLAAVPLAGASLNCTIPGGTPEGCVYCYSCRVEKTVITSYRITYDSVIDFERCRKVFGPVASDQLCRMALGLGFDFTKTERKTIRIMIEQEECKCDPVPVAMNCINSSDCIFILEYTSACFNTTTICHWNLPEADQVYMHLLKQDIEGNPNDGAVGCEDKLIMKWEESNEVLVTCGSPPTTRPAAKIYNRIYNEVPCVLFYDENGTEGCFQILVYLRRKMNKDNNTANITIDTSAPPSVKPFPTCCTCPIAIENIKKLCPKSWMNNTYITRLMKLRSTSNTCSGIGSTGFSGLKGCIGAEFHIHGTPPRALTKKECESTQLGLSDMEADIFLSDDGGSLWCGCNVQPPSRDSFCGGDDATRPDAKELIKLERLIAGKEDVDECANSDNAILREVAAFLQDNTYIPILSPCDSHV